MKFGILLAFIYMLAFTGCSRWYPEVNGYNENDFNNGFAGDLSKPIVGVKINGASFRVHVKGQGWKDETYGTFESDTPIDGIAINGKTYKVYINGRWLPSVNGYNIYDGNNGYAGILGNEIKGLMIQYTTYQVAVSDGGSPTPSPSSCGEQVFGNYKTGLRDVSTQKSLGLSEGCVFMAACVKGGIGNDKCILEAKQWALNNGYIRWDTLVYDKEGLARQISEHFGTNYQSNFQFRRGNGHTWLVDQNNREIFNSAGIGFHGY